MGSEGIEGGGEGALGAGADQDEHSGSPMGQNSSYTETSSAIQSASLPGVVEEQRPATDTSTIQKLKPVSGSCLEKRGKKRGRPGKGDPGVLDPELISRRTSYWKKMGFCGN